jgi:hypothetical protein
MKLIKDKKLGFLLLLGFISTAILFFSYISDNNSILESEQFSIFWPDKIRTGASDTIQILVDLDQDFLTIDNLALENDFQENLSLDDYFVNLEARVELAGIDIDPPGMMSKNILPGQKINFTWVIVGNFAGEYKGTIWLYLNLIPKQSSENSIKETLIAKPIKISVRNLLGLNLNTLRIIAYIMFFVSTIAIWFDARKKNTKLIQN